MKLCPFLWFEFNVNDNKQDSTPPCKSSRMGRQMVSESVPVEVTSVGEPVRQNNVLSCSWFFSEYKYYNGNNKWLDNMSDQTAVINQNCLPTVSFSLRLRPPIMCHYTRAAIVAVNFHGFVLHLPNCPSCRRRVTAQQLLGKHHICLQNNVCISKTEYTSKQWHLNMLSASYTARSATLLVSLLNLHINKLSWL